MALEAGSLRVTLNYARDIKHCDWFGRQDPYCVVRLGSREARSRVCRGAGRNPVWGDDETFHFAVTTETSLHLTLMDEDRGLTDDLIGTATIDLATVRQRGVQVVQAPVTKGKRTDKHQGIVQVSLDFVPSVRCSTIATAALRHPAAAGAPPQQPVAAGAGAGAAATWGFHTGAAAAAAAAVTAWAAAAAAAHPYYGYPGTPVPVAVPPAQPPAYGYGYHTSYTPGAAPVTPSGPASSPHFSSQPVH